MINRHPRAARIAAVIAYFWSYFHPSLKVAFFENLYNRHQPQDQRVSPNHVSEFIDKWAQHFLEYGDLLDEHGGGMPDKVPPQAALEAVTLIKDGYDTYVELEGSKQGSLPLGHHRVKVHRWWTSLVHAFEDLPRLREIFRECKCSIDQLWQAMLKVDPGLTKRRVLYKWSLDLEDLHKRVYYGQLLFNMWLTHRAQGNIFYRGVYIDECRIHMGQSIRHGVMVICDKDDTRVSEIIETPWLKPHQEVTLHFIVAVNPQVGLWYISMTTGTTPPVDNRPVNRNLVTHPYQVGSMLHVCPS